MPFNSSISENGEIVIDTGECLSVELAADFANALKDALESSDKVRLNFQSGLTMDITAIQIICSACKSAARQNKYFYFNGQRPQALTDLIIACGAERRASCKYNSDSTCIWFGGAN